MEKQSLSPTVKEYIDTYYTILDTMITDMTDIHLGNSISNNFISQMIPHHQGAINMCCNLLRFTSNTTLQEIAFTIIRDQTKSIVTMHNIESVCSKIENTPADIFDYQCQMNELMQVMFYRMRHVETSNAINIDFINEMIPHHQGAIQMAKMILEYPICKELKPIVDTIIQSQQESIIQMKKLVKEWSDRI